jgi:hypothetical protein
MKKNFLLLLTSIFLPIAASSYELTPIQSQLASENITQLGEYFGNITKQLIEQPDFRGNLRGKGSRFISKILPISSNNKHDADILDTLDTEISIRRKKNVPLHVNSLLGIDKFVSNPNSESYFYYELQVFEPSKTWGEFFWGEKKEIPCGVALRHPCDPYRNFDLKKAIKDFSHDDLIKDYNQIFSDIQTNWHEITKIPCEKINLRFFKQYCDKAREVYGAVRLINFLAKKWNLDKYIDCYNKGEKIVRSIERTDENFIIYTDFVPKEPMLVINRGYFDTVNSAFKFDITTRQEV